VHSGSFAEFPLSKLPIGRRPSRQPAIIKNPDVISKGMKITIPKLDDEKPAR
jgi:hypothetical protein